MSSYFLAYFASPQPSQLDPLPSTKSAAPPSPSAAVRERMDPEELKRVFETFDRNGDGRITEKELSDSLENLGIFIPKEELRRMIEKVDENDDGCVDLAEFGALYQSIIGDRDEVEEDMREAFNVFDRNGDGFITFDELKVVLDSLGLRQGAGAEDCKTMITKVDCDGDGKVDYNEFRQMMKGGLRALC